MKRLGLKRQFGIRTLLGLIVFAALGSLALNKYIQTRPPIQHAYSAEELQEHLQKGNPVLVTIDANWSIKSTARPRYMSANVSRLIRERGIVAMTADWTNHTPGVDKLMGRLNQNMVPTLAMFSPNAPESPIVLPHNATDAEIVSALDSLRSENRRETK